MMYDSLQSRQQAFKRGLLIRATVAGAFLVLLMSFGLAGLSEDIAGYRGFVAVLGVLVAVNPVLWWYGKRNGYPIKHFYSHWAVDVAAVTGLIYLLGTLDVPLAAAGYMVMIVSSSTFTTMRTAMGLAVLGATSYLGLALLDGLNVIPHMHAGVGVHLSSAGQAFHLGSAMTFFFVFAYLGGTLAEELREKAHVIGEQKERLEVAYRWEREVRAEMGLLSAVVQHDVYGPIAAVDGACNEAAESVRQGKTGDAQVWLAMARERLGSIESAVRTLGILGEQSELAADREGTAHLGSVARQVIQDAEPERARMEVILECEGEFGMVRVREEKAYHVVRNLVSNALKAAVRAKGGSVVIRGRRGLNCWEVEVEDDGVGLSEEVGRNLVLKRERSLQAAERGDEGFGKGLALCRSLVDGWGGSIEYSAGEGGRGSRFVVTFPVADEVQIRKSETV